MDTNDDRKVSVQAYAAADTLVVSIDKGTPVMGWFYSHDTLATPEEYGKYPRFAGAHYPLVDVGFFR